MNNDKLTSNEMKTEDTQEQTVQTQENTYIQEAAVSTTVPHESNATANDHVQQAKTLSKQYFQYFISALKHPYQSMKETNEEHFPNALITMGIIAILFPLLIVTIFLKLGIDIDFFGMIVQPMFYILLSIAISIGAICVILKLQKITLDYKRAAVQYATLLVPVPLLLLLACILSMIGLGTQETAFLFIAIAAFMLGAINMTILTYRSTAAPKFDVFYSIVIANVLIGYLFYKMISSVIQSMIMSALNMFFPF